MAKALDPFRFVLIAVAGWMNQRQLQLTEYLREENRALREQLVLDRGTRDMLPGHPCTDHLVRPRLLALQKKEFGCVPSTIASGTLFLAHIVAQSTFFSPMASWLM
jgi:hypothetical protein